MMKKKILKKTVLCLAIVSILIASPLLAQKHKPGDFQVTSGDIHFTKIQVKFSQPVDPTTISEESLYLVGPGGKLPRTLRYYPHERMIEVRLPITHIGSLLQPLVMVLTPAIKSQEGLSLSKGYVKGFNIKVKTNPRDHNGPFCSHTVVISQDPHIEIDPTIFFLVPMKGQYSDKGNTKGKNESSHPYETGNDSNETQWIQIMGNGKQTPDKDEITDWQILVKELTKRQQEYFQELKKSYKGGKKVETAFAELTKGSILPTWFCHMFHAPQVEISGVEDGKTYYREVTPQISAADIDNDLWYVNAYLNFSFFITNTPINQKDSYWLFALAVDRWHLGGYQLIRFTLATPPTVPEIVSLQPGEDLTVNKTPLTITGEVKNVTKVLVNGQEAPLQGNIFTTEVNLTPGPNAILVEALDNYDQSVQRSFTATYIPDTEPPVIAITSPQDAAYFNTPQIMVSGTVTDQSLIAYVKVNGQDAQVQDQNFTYLLTLNEGENTIVVESADVYQNQGSVSIKVVLDTHLPQVTISQPTSGTYMKTPQVAVQGTVEDTSPVTLKINGTAVSMQNNAFETTLVLTEGTNLIKVEAVDAAGNLTTSEVEVYADFTVPVLAVSSPTVDTITNQANITITGTITDVNPWKINLNTDTEGELIGNHFYFREVSLQEGENTFAFQAEDRAGNTVTHSLIVRRDSVLPQLVVLSPVPGALLPQRSVLVRGTVTDEHLKEVRINGTRGQVVENEFNLVVALVEGVNTITITAFDTAGNIKSESLQVTVDTLLPTINVFTPQNQAILNTPTITVTGRVDDIHISSVTVNGQAAGLSGTQFTLAGVHLQEGLNTITVEALDAAGNKSTVNVTVTLDTVVPEILAVVPADQARQVPLETEVQVEFSKAVDPATVTPQNFYLTKSFAGVEGAVFQKSPLVFVFKPSEVLPDSAEIFVYVTGGIKDLAGNSIKNPYTGSFFTRDITPPNAPELNPVPGNTSLTTITLGGTTESEITVNVTGGSSYVQGKSDAQGNFSLGVSLKPDQLNQLCVTAQDASGNVSIPSCVSVYQESGEFIVVDARFENNTVSVTFNKPIDAATLTAGNFVVSTAGGPGSGTITTSDDKTLGIFTPAADLTGQMILVEVKTGVKDSEGIPLSYPYTKMFNQQGGEIVVQGEVYDDRTGQPLAGALVKLAAVEGTAPAEPAPTAMTTTEGKYVLIIPAGQCVLRITKEGYTYSDRLVMSAVGFGATVFDSRLTPLGSEEKTLAPEGGTISAGGGSLVCPDGTVDIERSVRITPVGSQGIQGRLPTGWSPLATFDIRLSSGLLLKSCQLRTPWPPPSQGVGAAHLDLPKLLINPVVPNNLILARWDESLYTWEAVSAVAVSAEDIGGDIDKAGQYAFLVKDTEPVSPAQPVIGQPLSGVQPGTIPYPPVITAQLEFAPSAILPGDTSFAVLTINSTTPISSGVPVQAKIDEKYQLLTGTTAAFVPYTADLTVDNYGEAPAVVGFALSPNSTISLPQLKIGTIKSDMVRYNAGTAGMVVGPAGATVTGDNGAEIVIAAGAVSAPTVVSIKKVESADLESQGMVFPSGFELIGAIELSLGGAALLKPAVISLALTQEQIDNLPQDAQFLTVRLEKSDYQFAWVLKSQALVENSRMKSFIEIGTGLSFPGIKEGGTYLFLRALVPVGYITGLVSQETQPLTGAVVSADNHEIKAISTNTNTNTNYVQIGIIGTNSLTAKNLTSRDEGTGTAEIQTTGEIVSLNLTISKTGPQVVGITPENNAVGVPLNSKITFIFSEAIKATTFNEQTVYVYKGTERVGGVFKLSTDGKQGELDPHQDFVSDSIINITVTTGLQDLQGNPMAEVYTASFRTLDIVPPTADLTRIFVRMPENGISTITGAAGAVEPGSTVIVFNERTGKAVTVTGLSDGSFNVTIEAVISDKITVKVVDPAGNETTLDSKPFVSADGKKVVLDSKANEFISSEGLGIKIQEGTFTGSTAVGLYEITDPQTVPPMPQEYQCLKSLVLDFGGQKANKPVDLSIPVPAGITNSANIFAARQVEVLGQKRWMIIDATVIKDGRISTACEPFEDYWRELDGTISFIQNYLDVTAAFITGFSGASTVIFLGDLCYLPQNGYYVFPVRVNREVTIIAKDAETGETIFEKTTAGPTMAGQVYSFQKIADTRDNEPPMIVKSLGLLTFGFDVTAQAMESQGITVTPTVDDEGKITAIKIEGKAGTAAVRREDDPAGTPEATIRVYKLQKEEDTEKYEYVKIDEFKALMEGSFSQEGIAVEQGNRVLVTVEKGDIPLNQEFILSFSEPLSDDYKNGDVPISIYKVEEGSETEVQVKTQMLETGTEVSIKLENQLQENQVYVLKTWNNQGNLTDRNGNTLNIECNFRAKRSYTLYADTGENEIFDTLLMGSTLFVAAGTQGLRVMDVSNPADIKTISTYNIFADKIKGLAKYREDVNSPYKLVVVGGGTSCLGFIKILNISDLKNITQEKTQIISDNYTDSSTLPDGSPRHVRLLDHYAFVTVYGAGLAVVDLLQMTEASNRKCVVRYHYESYVNDVAVYKRKIEDPTNPGTETDQYVAVILVDYYGIKILDINRSANEEPTTDPYAKYNMLEIGNYQVPERKHLMGLVLAKDYWVDIDGDGRKGDEEDKDEEKDNEIMGENITQKDETRNMVFFSVPSLQRLVILDITEPGKDMTSYGELKVKDDQGNYAQSIGEMSLSKEDRLLYVADMQMGLILLDVNLSGKSLATENQEKMFLGNIVTSGASRFGIVIDEELNTAYVGQIDKGVEIIKLANPELKFVYKKENQYVEVTKISPSGIKDSDNPQDYPDEIYVMALLPGGIAKNDNGDDKKALCELWALNRYGAPVVPWENSKVKTYIKTLELYRQSDDPGDQWYKVFLSKPIRVTQDPEENRLIHYTDRNGLPQTSDIKIMSGDLMWGHLSYDFILDYNQQNYISSSDAVKIGDRKPSTRADFIDREENFAFEGVAAGAEEKPNSPVNNPSMYSNVYMHSGEYIHNEVDLQIPGRGFDFVFQRTYRSQGIYSGVLGWGWDHSYNKRLLEMPAGDIIYYDGTGRRERFKALKTNDVITGYESPTGWFVELKKSQDGMFYIIYPDRTLEIFDNLGYLTKIQDRSHNKMEFSYNTAGQLASVMDTMGRMIQFYYEDFSTEGTGENTTVNVKSGRLIEIKDFSNRSLKFDYNEKGELITVNFEGRVTHYEYTESSDLKLAHNLKKVIDPKGQETLTLNYNGDKVASQDIGGSQVAFTPSEDTASVTDGRGNAKTFTHQEGQAVSITEGGAPTGFSYNSDGLVQGVTYPEGNNVTYGYQGGDNRRSAANLNSIIENPGLRGDGNCVKAPTTFTYDNYYNQVTSVGYANGLTVNNLNPDEKGNFQQVTTNIPGIEHKYTYNKYGQITSETDALDMSTTYDYHSESTPGGNDQTTAGRQLDPGTGGYLKAVSSPLNTQNFEKYDKRGNIEEFNDTQGGEATYHSNTYDELENETAKSASSLSPLTYSATYGYDNNGNVTSRNTNYGGGEAPVSNTYNYTYTPRNMMHTETEMGRGMTTTYGYDANDNIESISNNIDFITFTYNNRDLVETVRDGTAPGASTFYYDGNGNIRTSADPYGHSYTYQYDGYDRLKEIKDPLNNKTVIQRADMGNKVTLQQLDTAENILRETVRVNDPLGRMTQYAVNLPGAAGETYTYSYQDGGKTTIITDALDRTWTIKKNEQGQVYEETDPAGNKIEYFYEDGRGNMTRKVETEKGEGGIEQTYTTEYTYNSFNKVEIIKEIVAPNKAIYTTFTYDEKGNLTGTKDAEGNIVTHKYDDLGRKIRTEQHFKDGTKIATEFTYYPNDLLKTIKDDKGNITTYEYDDQKRLTKVTYPDDSFIRYTYTEKTIDGKKYRQVIEKQRNGTQVTNYYDEMNRLVNRDISLAQGGAGTTAETYEYDGLSRLARAEDDDTAVEIKYDALNRIVEEKQQGKLIKYTYEVVDNLRRMTLEYPNQRIIRKDFDILDRISGLKQLPGQDSIAGFSYIGRSYRYLSRQFGNQDAISYLYDQGRRLTSKEARNRNSQLIDRFDYGYNNVHMKMYEQRGHDANKGDVFSYDEIYRLTKIKFNSPSPTTPGTDQYEKQKEYKFDKLHNIMSIVETQNGQTDTMTTIIPVDSNYSKLNQYERFDQWGLAYDLNGNTTQKGTQHFTYDYRNQVVSAKEGTTMVDFKYDPLGRRVQKIVNSGTQGKTTQYFYDGNQVIEERDGDDNVLKQYIYGNGIDEIIRMDKYNESTAVPYYYHTNAIGSVTAITDENGNLIERVAYDTYGMPTFTDYQTDPKNPSVVANSVIGNDILFHGRTYDIETNLYYYRARYYDPIMGRFLQTDPMGYKDSMNLYHALNSNPINFIDPQGLEPVKKYAGTVSEIVNVMNSSPSRIGLKKGDQAIKALLYFGETDITLKGPMPANTPYFNTKKGRYIYTKKGGWIDMVHFLFYAGRAYSYKVQKKDAEKLMNNLYYTEDIYMSLYQMASIEPFGEAMQEGYQQEKLDSIFSPHSAYSYEDLPSDKFGIIFALHYFDPQSQLTLAEQIANFLNNILGATVPTTAPNWNIMPNIDTKNPPTQTNKTTTPIYTSEDVKNYKLFLKWLESFFK